MNSLYQQLMGNQSHSLPNNIKTMINNFKMISNPQAYIQQAMQNNPQLKSILQAAGGNPEKAFRDMAKQMNVNPDEIIQMLK